MSPICTTKPDLQHATKSTGNGQVVNTVKPRIEIERTLRSRFIFSCSYIRVVLLKSSLSFSTNRSFLARVPHSRSFSDSFSSSSSTLRFKLVLSLSTSRSWLLNCSSANEIRANMNKSQNKCESWLGSSSSQGKSVRNLRRLFKSVINVARLSIRSLRKRLSVNKVSSSLGPSSWKEKDSGFEMVFTAKISCAETRTWPIRKNDRDSRKKLFEKSLLLVWGMEVPSCRLLVKECSRPLLLPPSSWRQPLCIADWAFFVPE